MKAKEIKKTNVLLFAKACAAASGMAVACTALARSIVAGRRGIDAYKASIAELGAIAEASQDGNAHTVRRYTAEAIAVIAQHGGKVEVPTVAADRTEKAQKARKSLGIKPRGTSTKREKTKTGNAPKPKATDGLAWFNAQMATPAGRAAIIRAAKACGYDMLLSPVLVAVAPAAEPGKVADKPIGARARKAARKPSAAVIQ